MRIRTFSFSDLFGAFLPAAVAVLALMANAMDESFNPARVAAVLCLLIAYHLICKHRIFFSRELILYAVFFVYMLLSLLWAPDAKLGTNTLFPALDCILILIYFSSLIAYCDVRAVLSGILAAFLLGAIAYFLRSGFPLAYPQDFSYNTVAGMYLFGLLMSLFYGWHTRSRWLVSGLAMVLMGHIAATTSIKTNLGILLAAVAALFLYFRHSLKALRSAAVALLAVVGVLVYVVVTNEDLMQKLRAGTERVGVGFEILQAREDSAGSTSFGEREYWQHLGIQGWSGNPLFGFGVEAFRSSFGITSHSTPIDLLYNTGLIGLVLFYAVFASLAWRLVRARHSGEGQLHALIAAGLVCYAFMTLSATMHYQQFMVCFIALSVGLLRVVERKDPVAMPSLQLAQTLSPGV